MDKEIKVSGDGMSINTIRYVDNIMLIANNIDYIQYLANLVGQQSKNLGLNINTKKTNKICDYH